LKMTNFLASNSDKVVTSFSTVTSFGVPLINSPRKIA
jgi:hypothetical protein